MDWGDSHGEKSELGYVLVIELIRLGDGLDVNKKKKIKR